VPHYLKFIPRESLNQSRSGSYARNNMSFRLVDASGDVHEADTLDEYHQLVQAFGKKGGSAPASTSRSAASPVFQRPATSASPTGFGAYTRPPAPGRGRARGRAVEKAVEDIGIHSLSKSVGQALGGMESYCPGRLAAKGADDKLPHLTTLTEIGLSETQIKEFAMMLLAAGLLEEKRGVTVSTGLPYLTLIPSGGSGFKPQEDLNKVALAKRLLAEHFSVSCPGTAKNNRGSGRW
jgi:hypothetical protein